MTGEEVTKELLVAILKRIESLDTLKKEFWYHIPVDRAPKRWPPKSLAFYQGGIFGSEEAYKIRYYGEVSQIDVLPRKELFPGDQKNLRNAENLYYHLQLKILEERKPPIISLRPRRLTFFPTTWKKFIMAEQINDLFDGSPLEDHLWSELKGSNISAERQWWLPFREHN